MQQKLPKFLINNMRTILIIIFAFKLIKASAETSGTIVINYKDCVKCKVVIKSLITEFPELKLCLNGANKSDIKTLSKSDDFIKKFQKRVVVNKIYNSDSEGYLIIEEDGKLIKKAHLFSDYQYLSGFIRFYLVKLKPKELKYSSPFTIPHCAKFNNNYTVLYNDFTRLMEVYNSSLTTKLNTINLNKIGEAFDTFAIIKAYKKQEREIFNTPDNKFQDSVILDNISTRFISQQPLLDSCFLYAILTYYVLSREPNSNNLIIDRKYFLYQVNLTNNDTKLRLLYCNDENINPSYGSSRFITYNKFYTLSLKPSLSLVEGMITQSDTITIKSSNLGLSIPPEITSVFDNNFRDIIQNNNLIHFNSFTSIYDLGSNENISFKVNDSLMYTPNSMQDIDLNKMLKNRININTVCKTPDNNYKILFFYNAKTYWGLIYQNRLALVKPLEVGINLKKLKLISFDNEKLIIGTTDSPRLKFYYF